MPRLRRAAMHRRQRPQLAEEVWLWLQGKKTREQVSKGTVWDIFVLEGEHLQQERERYREAYRCNRPAPSARSLSWYWDRVRQAVLDGEIEVSEVKVHNFDDAPLIVTSE